MTAPGPIAGPRWITPVPGEDRSPAVTRQMADLAAAGLPAGVAWVTVFSGSTPALVGFSHPGPGPGNGHTGEYRTVHGFAWPASTTIRQLPGGRWSAWLSDTGSRYSHPDLTVVHDMITRADAGEQHE